MAKESNLLSISFSAYNRGDILLENLNKMLPEISRHNVPVYISDDSTDGATRQAVEQLKRVYPFIYYRHNAIRLGHDRNVFAALAFPNTSYVWYLGDSMFFKEGALDLIFSSISDGADFLFINSHGLRASYLNGSVKDVGSFISEMAWHLTLTGATVYGKRCLNWMPSIGDLNYKYKNFLQLGIIFEFMSCFDAQITWVQEAEVNPNAGKTTYWRENAVRVFAVDWAHAIEAAPIFDSSERVSIIKSHSLKTGIFGFGNLLAMRADGAFSAEILMQCRREIKMAFRTPMSLAWFISRVPQKVAARLVECVKHMRSVIRNKAISVL